jgi:hypothetical protein
MKDNARMQITYVSKTRPDTTYEIEVDRFGNYTIKTGGRVVKRVTSVAEYEVGQQETRAERDRGRRGSHRKVQIVRWLALSDAAAGQELPVHWSVKRPLRTAQEARSSCD